MAGVIGLALIRHWYLDGDVNNARMAELSDLLGRLDEPPFSKAVNPVNRDLDAGYADWAASYDGPNPMIESEEAAVRPILESLAGPGVQVLDAACGTGRHAAFLTDHGCTVTGVDQSEAMLAVARSKVPGARFECADIRDLPYKDGEFDLVVISLALSHLADPTGALVELRRVLLPGGTLVITDPHPSCLVVGGQAFYGSVEPGRPVSWIRNHYHSTSTWLRAFRTAGLVVEDCQEPTYTDAQIVSNPAASAYPDALLPAIAGLSSLWVWTLRRR